MSSLRTQALRALVILGLSGPAMADDTMLRLFAGCTGRISAEMEHAWLVNDTRADALQAQRVQFVSILEAIVPPERARDMLNYRIDTKLAHSAILTTARFGTDARRADMAKKQALSLVRQCQSLLLDS